MSPTPETIPFGPSSSPLVGQWYPAQGQMQAAMVLHGATGVPQRFYRHFAAWAAERGIEGSCDVRFDVDTRGKPYNVEADCTDRVFKREAERAVSRVEFAPKIIRGQAAERRNVVYPLQFTLEQ